MSCEFCKFKSKLNKNEASGYISIWTTKKGKKKVQKWILWEEKKLNDKKSQLSLYKYVSKFFFFESLRKINTNIMKGCVT